MLYLKNGSGEFLGLYKDVKNSTGERSNMDRELSCVERDYKGLTICMTGDRLVYVPAKQHNLHQDTKNGV